MSAEVINHKLGFKINLISRIYGSRVRIVVDLYSDNNDMSNFHLSSILMTLTLAVPEDKNKSGKKSDLCLLSPGIKIGSRMKRKQ